MVIPSSRALTFSMLDEKQNIHCNASSISSSPAIFFQEKSKILCTSMAVISCRPGNGQEKTNRINRDIVKGLPRMRFAFFGRPFVISVTPGAK